jgi:hypothetical protein
MSDIPEKLPVKGIDDLLDIPTPEKPQDIHKVEGVSEGLEADKFDVSLTFWEKLDLFLGRVSEVADKTVQAISDMRSIITGLKWVAVIIVAGLIVWVVIRAIPI